MKRAGAAWNAFLGDNFEPARRVPSRVLARGKQCRAKDRNPDGRKPLQRVPVSEVN